MFVTEVIVQYGSYRAGDWKDVHTARRSHYRSGLGCLPEFVLDCPIRITSACHLQVHIKNPFTVSVSPYPMVLF